MRNKVTRLVSVITIFLCLACTVQGKTSKYWKVYKINFTGNVSINKDDLLGVMDLTPKFLEKPVRFSESRLRSDLSVIDKYYKSEGYLNAKVKADSVQRDTAKYRVSVFIGIQEGERTLFDSIKYTYHRGVFDSSVIKNLKCRSGKPLLLSSIDDDCQKLSESFASKGFLSAEVKPEISIDSLRNRADITFIITEGPRVRVGKIQLKGSEGLAKRFTFRELEFKPGDTLTLQKIRKSEQQLYRTNLFRFVKIEPAYTDSTDTTLVTALPDSAYPIDVRVNKADYFQIQTGLGYGTSEGIRASLNTSYGNFFAIGHKLTLLGNISNRLQHGEIIYSMPWFFTIPIEFDASVYINRYDSIFGQRYDNLFIHSESNNPYRGLFEGWKLTFGRPADWGLSYQLWLKWENVRWLTPTTTIPDTVPKENTQSVGFGVSYDTRSDLIDPQRGILNVLKTDVAGLTGTNSARFVKVTNDFSIYWKYRKFRFASALKIGVAVPYGDSLDKAKDVPLQEQFTAGGTRSVRGYKENCLSIDESGHSKSGDVMITANILELRFPIVWKISGALFTDAGYVWDEKSFFHRQILESLKEIRLSAGPGLRLSTSIAIIRFDAGFKIGWRKAGESPYELHFDIGQAF